MYVTQGMNPIFAVAAGALLIAILAVMQIHHRKVNRSVLDWVQQSRRPLVWQEEDEREGSGKQAMEMLVEYCLSKPGAKEDRPFGPEPLVVKVGGKMFALVSETSLSLKCDPVIAENLREQHPAVTPGYHLNKKHWNSIRIDGSLTEEELRDLIDHSYSLVLRKLPKADRVGIEASQPR